MGKVSLIVKAVERLGGSTLKTRLAAASRTAGSSRAVRRNLASRLEAHTAASTSASRQVRSLQEAIRKIEQFDDRTVFRPVKLPLGTDANFVVQGDKKQVLDAIQKKIRSLAARQGAATKLGDKVSAKEFADDIKRLKDYRKNTVQNLPDPHQYTVDVPAAVTSKGVEIPAQTLTGSRREILEQVEDLAKAATGRETRLGTLKDVTGGRQQAARKDPNSLSGFLGADDGPGRIGRALRGVDGEGKTWAQRNRLAAVGLGAVGFGGVPLGLDIIEGIREKNRAGSAQNVQSIGDALGRQQLRMLEYAAAMERLQVSGQQNLAILAQQNPHVFNEVVAGRRLAPGMVSVGGDRNAMMQRLASVGTGMAAGDFARMGTPNALDELSVALGY